MPLAEAAAERMAAVRQVCDEGTSAVRDAERPRLEYLYSDGYALA